MNDIETGPPQTYDLADSNTSAFSFYGRISQRRFVFMTLAPYAFMLAAGIFGGFEHLDLAAGGTRNIIAALGSAAASWISFAAYAKRWHDLGKSGWNALWQAVPLVNLAVWLHLARTDGVKEPNEHGEPPENSYL